MKKQQLTEEQKKEMVDRFNKLVKLSGNLLTEYSFVTKPKELLLDEDDEEPQSTPIQDPNINIDIDEKEPVSAETEQPLQSEPIQDVQPISNNQEITPQEGSGEVEIDVTDLTKEQDKIADDVDRLSAKSEEIYNTLLDITNKIEQFSTKTDDEIRNLKSEFEKRNPTSKEILQKRVVLSSPFNQTPENYWDEKQKDSNYVLSDDDDDEKEYVVKASDINDNPMNVYKNFGLTDDDFSQSFGNLMGV